MGEERIGTRKQEEQLRKKAAKERLLNQTALKIRRSLELTEILNSTVVEVRKMLACDRVVVYQFDQEYNGEIVAESIAHGWTVSLNAKIEDTCFRTGGVERYLEGHKTVINNIYKANLTECHRQLLQQFEVKANLVVPIIIKKFDKSQLWGLLIAHQCSAPREWTQEQLELLDDLSVHFSIAIVQSELYQEIKENNEKLEQKVAEKTTQLKREYWKSRLFAEITLKIRQSLELETILQNTVAEVQQLLNCDRVLIYQIFSDGKGTTIAEAVKGKWLKLINTCFPEPVFPLKYQKKYSEGLVKAISNVEEAYGQKAPCMLELMEKLQVKAKLVVPIIQNNKLWGVTIAQNCGTAREWTEFEIELMQQIADQVSIALQQSQLLAALEESQAQIQDLLDNANDLIQSVCLENGQFIYVNRAWQEILGYKTEEMINLNVFDILHPNSLEKYQQVFKKLQQGVVDHVEGIELSFLTKEGDTVLVEGNINSRRQGENPIATRAIFRDITYKKKAEAELRKALEKEQEVNQLKTQFINLTSHEFRTPLTVILGSAKYLERRYDKINPEKLNKYITNIKNGGERLEKLIEDMLTIIRLESGKLNINLTKLNLREYCQSIIEELLVGKEEECQLNLNTECLGGEELFLDEKILRAILTNLLVNAIKYSPSGSRIDLKVSWKKKQVIFEIKDQGIGIPQEDQIHLFKSFHRASNVGNIPGTGLGLNIVKKYVEVMGGEVMFVSEVGKGTTFTVKLPISQK